MTDTIETTSANPSPKPRQDKTRIIIIGAVIFVILCLVACGVVYFSLRKAASSIVKTDPEQTKKLASQIADYDLPAGYQELLGIELAGMTFVGFVNETSGEAIYLAQSPFEGTLGIEDVMQRIAESNPGNPVTWTPADVKTYPIRGEDSAITIYHGTAQDGQEYTAWGGKFNGKGGEAIVVIYGPAETWEDSNAEDFISSLR